MQAEDDALAPFGNPGLDPAVRRIAALHRERKCPTQQRRAHAIVLARRHFAGVNEPLGAATDGAEQRAHLHLAGLGRANHLLVQLGTAGTDIPERLALHLRHGLGCHSPRKTPPGSRHAVQIKANTRHPFHRIGLGRTPLYPQTPEKTRKALFMLECSPRDEVVIAAPVALSAWRPILVFLSVGLTMAGLTWLAVIALSPGGFGAVDLVLAVLFAVTLPWYVIGFWNAAIGLLIMRFARDPVAAVMPVAGRVRGDDPITASTAVLLCIRNEPPERVVRLLEPMMEGLAARGVGARFHVYVLSDTSEADTAAAEDARFAALAAAWRGQIALTYRRRTQNTGFKAGNIRDFCQRWGKDHDFAIMLDADSVMTVDLVLKLVRIMQIDPRLGIVQSLVIGMPSASAFARIFQFGMRLSMRSYTIGSAWWQGDCGPYWGHNAIVRIAPFVTHCQLPVLAEGALVKGHVLSHDQIEAVLMRRAGYGVRVLAGEGSSFEQNPPTLLEFIR